MDCRVSEIEAILFIFVAVTINIIFFYGIIIRPVVSYHINTSLDYNATINFNSDNLFVDLKVENEGLSPANIILIVRLYNMSLVSPLHPNMFENDFFNEIRIPLERILTKHGQEGFTIELEGMEYASYQVLVFSIEGKLRKDPFLGFYDSFAIFRPVRPTALLLKDVGDNRYMRVKSR
jgi:hypothetical protein